MMHEFLSANRSELIDRCREKVAQRAAPKATAKELEHGIPMFLDQLIKTLQMEQGAEPMQSRRVSGPAGGGKLAPSEISETARLHGRELSKLGFTIEQVVHDYGDLCQSIMDLAFDRNAPFEIDEFRTLNRCLDNGIAEAVTEYSIRRDVAVADQQTLAMNERLGFFTHELRNFLNSATLALNAVKEGNLGLSGATAAVLDRSLVGMSNLIDRTLSEIRMTAGLPVHRPLFSLAEFIAEIKLSASLEARLRECLLTVSDVDPQLAVAADRELLASALGNLLQNAFKFTHPKSEVTLKAYASADRILIDVEDNCGGLSISDPERMFQPFTRAGNDHSGLGLGLSISRRGVEANEGILSVRDVPQLGCVFTIDLPRHSMTTLLSAS